MGKVEREPTVSGIVEHLLPPRYRKRQGANLLAGIDCGRKGEVWRGDSEVAFLVGHIETSSSQVTDKTAAAEHVLT